MNSTADLVATLDRTPLFGGLGKSALRRIAGLTKQIDHDDGHTVVREGWGAHAMHVIVEGTAVVTAGGTEVARLGPGDSFGEVALFDPGPRTATVTADGPLKLLGIEGAAFRQLVEEEGALAARFLEKLAAVIRATNGSLCEWQFPVGGEES